jgi:hypothetical protein
VVGGRLINGYTTNDMILSVLYRWVVGGVEEEEWRRRSGGGVEE